MALLAVYINDVELLSRNIVVSIVTLALGLILIIAYVTLSFGVWVAVETDEASCDSEACTHKETKTGE